MRVGLTAQSGVPVSGRQGRPLGSGPRSLVSGLLEANRGHERTSLHSQAGSSEACPALAPLKHHVHYTGVSDRGRAAAVALGEPARLQVGFR